MSNIKTHMMREFKAAGWLEEPIDEMTQSMMTHLLKMGEVFSDEGHSGFSASYAIGCLETLLRFKPLVPLTGQDDEWNNVSDSDDITVFQNNRCPTVFKQTDRFDGKPYDINGKVFWEWYERDLDPDEEGYPGKSRDKSHFTNGDSFVVIEFPYTPTTEYIEVR